MTPEQDRTIRALTTLCMTDNPDQGRPTVSYGFLRELLAIIGPLTEEIALLEQRLARVQKEADQFREGEARATIMLEHMRDRMNARDT